MERIMELLPPPPGAVDLGDLARLTPVSDVFGYDRGNPVDRHYIETFLAMNASAIRGHALEIGDATYTRRFGGRRVTKSDVLHVRDGNPAATIVADLTDADHLPSNTFDCVIVTQTLHLIFDAAAAVRTIQRILRPGGVVLATVPGISQISRNEWSETWYWSFTEPSARQIFESAFGRDAVRIQSHGNVLAATAFLQGMASRELRLEELEHRDASYPVTITIRAEKPRPDVRHRRRWSAARNDLPANPRLSIIVVYGNAEPFIAEAVESVLHQTTPEWELLLIENGSGDCSATMAARYERDTPARIRCLRYEGEEDDSAGGVWRWALQQARGEFVARLDPDHIWSEDVAAGLLASLDSAPAAVLARAPAARWQRWFEDTNAGGPEALAGEQSLNDTPARHDRACCSTLAARRVELLRLTARPGPHADALSALDPRVRPGNSDGVVFSETGRVECRVRDAMSGCGGLSISSTPALVRARHREPGAIACGEANSPVSLVICTRDRPEHIAACLEAAMAQTHPAGEIIVVENAPPSDAATRVIRRFPVRHRIQPIAGLSHARNLGVAAARFDIIAFTDDDARPDPHWLRIVAHAFADPQVMAVTGLVLPAVLETPAQSLFEDACGGMGRGAKPVSHSRRTMSLHSLMATERVGVGANMAFRRSALEQLGGFDIELGAGSPGRAAEDLDMFHRVLAAGMTLRYEPAAIVRHHHRTGLGELKTQLDDAAHGYATYIEKLRRGTTVPARSAARFRARWYAWLVSRVVLGKLGLKEVPTEMLRSQLRTALAVRRGRSGNSHVPDGPRKSGILPASAPQ